MSKHYELEFKNKIFLLHFDGRRILKILADEYGFHMHISQTGQNSYEKNVGQTEKPKQSVRF